MCGFADVIVAGGVESMSMVPMGGNKVSPSPVLVESLIEAYTPMGITAENVAERFNISREDQDKLALRSHQNAAAAIKEGRFKEEIVPVKVIDRYPGPDNKIVEKEFVFDTDEGRWSCRRKKPAPWALSPWPCSAALPWPAARRISWG
jgi:acetyl-CoA acyltransferase